MVFGNYTAKDKFNSIASYKLSEAEEDITIVGIEIEEKTDEQGKTFMSATIKNSDGKLFGTISDVVTTQLEAVGQMLEEGTKEVTVRVAHRTSGNKRDYIVLEMI